MEMVNLLFGGEVRALYPSIHHDALTQTTVIGVLKGRDPLLNLVLDDCKEYLRGMLGLAVF